MRLSQRAMLTATRLQHDSDMTERSTMRPAAGLPQRLCRRRLVGRERALADAVEDKAEPLARSDVDGGDHTSRYHDHAGPDRPPPLDGIGECALTAD